MNLENIEANADIKNLLNFASGVITARERVHLQMSEHRMGVFRQEVISELTGLSIGGIEDEWLRIKRQKITVPNSPPDYINEFIKNPKSWDPASPPVLEAAIAKTISVDEASELMAAGLLTQENIIFDQFDDANDHFSVNIVLHSSNLKEMCEEYAKWLEEVWKTWSQEEKPRRQSIKLYDNLFQIYAFGSRH